MRTRLEKRLKECRAEGRKALFIYLTAGLPINEGTVEAICRLEEAGADVIELGLPFSDPMADGAVIQRASTAALKHGMTTAKALEIVRMARTRTEIPIIGMGYTNMILRYGLENFVMDAKASGMDGLILPDMPHEEAEELQGICRKQAFHLAEFLTPMTTQQRLDAICKTADGFLYCVSHTGVTGVQQADYSAIGEVMRAARERTELPLAIGFGIGNADSARAAAQYADAVIVGSAVVQRLLEGRLDLALQLVAEILRGLDEA